MLSRSVGEADAGQRLDRYLRKALKTTPLSAIFRHLRSGRILVDGKKAKPELRLVAGMELTIHMREAGSSARRVRRSNFIATRMS